MFTALAVLLVAALCLGVVMGLSELVRGLWVTGGSAADGPPPTRTVPEKKTRPPGTVEDVDLLGEGEVAELIDEVEAGIAELESSRSARDAVIACWLRLEQAAERLGVPARRTDTATDLVTRLLAAAQLPRGALDGLARRYLRARYSTHPVTDDDRGLAHRELRETVDALTRTVRRVPAGIGAGSATAEGRG